MKIGIVEGSVRDGRAGAAVAQWVAQNARHDDVEFELIELAKFDVPLLTTSVIPGTANKQYESPAVQAWSDAIDACDGYIFVSPEYNHSVPGAFKNAVDSIGPEFQGKSLAVVAYGADGGVRAGEHWRQIMANFNMHVVRSQMTINRFTEFDGDTFAPNERRAGELDSLVETLVASAKQRQA